MTDERRLILQEQRIKELEHAVGQILAVHCPASGRDQVLERMSYTRKMHALTSEAEREVKRNLAQAKIDSARVKVEQAEEDLVCLVRHQENMRAIQGSKEQADD